MKFIKAVTSGTTRALRSLKALLIIWLLTFSFLAVFLTPLKSFVNTALGNTASTNLLNNGFNISFFTDLGQSFNPMMSAISGGVLILLLLFFFLYIFMYGGLFDSLLENRLSYKPGEFFRASARYFLSYTAVVLISILIILFVMFLVIGLPLIIQDRGSEESLIRLMKILRIVAILILPVFLLVADYARVWLAANDQKKVFKALGYGFKATFRSFLGSYFFMLLMVIIQALFTVLVVDILAAYTPDSGGGMFLLFMLSQLLFLIRIFLRAVRYGGIAALYQL